jgi:hypothetical protein
MARADLEHKIAIARLEEHMVSCYTVSEDTRGWFEHMPEYQQWIRSNHGTLCYIDEDVVGKSALISMMVGTESSRAPNYGNTIYIDISRYSHGSQMKLQVCLVRLLLLQALYLIPEGSQRLLEYMTEITFQEATSLQDFLRGEMSALNYDCLVRMVGEILSVKVKSKRVFWALLSGLYVVLDHADCLEDTFWRLLPRGFFINTHIMIAARRVIDFGKRSREFITISQAVERTRKY